MIDLFRNVTGSPSDPMDTWPHECFVAAMSYGSMDEWAPIAAQIWAHPHGQVATHVEEILGYVDPSDEEEAVSAGVWQLFTDILADARRTSLGLS